MTVIARPLRVAPEPEQRPTVAVAFRCGMCADPDRRALRFNLNRQTKRADGVRTTRGCGRLYLCQPCWEELTRGSRRRGGSAPK